MRKISMIFIVILMLCVACEKPEEDCFDKFREIAYS